MNSLLLDLEIALRFFARRRATFAVIVATMALALGANTAVFSVLKAFLFSSLGVPEAGRVMFVWTTKDLPGRGRLNFNDSYVNFRLLRDTTHFWEKIATTLPSDVNWEQDTDTRRLQGSLVTADFFDLMRVRPVLGRVFSAREEGPHAAPVALISDALWRGAFGGDPGVVGRTLRLNGAPHTIIGVLPAGFAQPQGTEIWLPFDLPPSLWAAVSSARQLSTYVRLAPGVTQRAADEELRAFAPRAVEADAANRDWGWAVQPLRQNILAGADQALVFVQAGALVLLLLAITNLASLLLAWAAERQRETAVRLALGASTWRVVRQFLIQSLALVSVGGGLGLWLAWLALPGLQRLNPNPQYASFLNDAAIDRGTLLFAAALVLGTGLLTGLLPAWQARRTELNEALRSESRGASLSRGALRWQRTMVVSQAAISVLILVSAGFAGLGFYRLSQVNLGFDPEQRTVFHVQFPEPAYGSHGKRAQFVRTFEQNLAQEPALLGYGITTTLPVGDFQWGGGFFPQLLTGEYPKDPLVFHHRRVSPHYLSAMGIPLIEGRLLDERDRIDAPPVVVVSKALADKYWPGQSALGRKMRRTAPADSPMVEIVGVVGDVLDAGAGLPAGETVYTPFEQVSMRKISVVLHGRGSASDTLAAGRRALATTAPGVAAYDLAPLEELAWQANAVPRLLLVLLGIFAIIAVGITALGTYGVMSQLVANRQKEMAIRSALGATPGSVLRMVLGQNAKLASLGVGAGLGGAWAAAHGVASLVPGLETGLLWPYAVVALAVLGLTQIASLIPAVRAARLEVQKTLSSSA